MAAAWPRNAARSRPSWVARAISRVPTSRYLIRHGLNPTTRQSAPLPGPLSEAYVVRSGPCGPARAPTHGPAAGRRLRPGKRPRLRVAGTPCEQIRNELGADICILFSMNGSAGHVWLARGPSVHHHLDEHLLAIDIRPQQYRSRTSRHEACPPTRAVLASARLVRTGFAMSLLQSSSGRTARPIRRVPLTRSVGLFPDSVPAVIRSGARGEDECEGPEFARARRSVSQGASGSRGFVAFANGRTRPGTRSARQGHGGVHEGSGVSGKMKLG